MDFLTSTSATCDRSVHFTVDVRRNQGPNVGGHRTMPSDFYEVVTNFCDTSLASCLERDYDHVLEEISSVVALRLRGLRN